MQFDDAGVRGGDRFRAQVALRDVAQPSFAQRRVALVYERCVADVAGLGDEYGAQARGEALEPGVWLLVVRERVDESGLGGDLEHEVWQVGCGQQRVHAVPQRDQRWWLGSASSASR